MKNLKEKITKFEQEGSELRKEIIDSIKDFLNQYGHGPKKTFTIDFEMDEIIDPVTLLVETDRHTGDMGYESLESIRYDKNNDLCFETDSYIAMVSEINLFDLIEIYIYLDYISDKENWDDFEIKDGTLRLTD